MKTINKLFIIFIFLVGVSVKASFINDKKGFWITPKAVPQNALVLKKGEEFVFEGEVCVVKWSYFGHEKCLKIPSSKVVFKAYYPDTLHDVTDQLEMVQANDKKTWKYKFKTSALKDVDLNQFTLTVGSSSKKADDLLKVKAKFEKRILILKEFRNRYGGRQHYHKNITYLTELISYLQLLVSRIDVALDNNPEILAQIRQPIQVENKISGPMIYSSNFSGHKITLRIPVGVPFEGEKAKIETSVTNLSDRSFYFPGFEDENDEGDSNHQTITGDQSYRLSLDIDGQSLLQTQYFSLGFGKTNSISFFSPMLNPNRINKIKVNLERSSTGRFDYYNFFSRRLGSLSYDLNVVEDKVTPEIAVMNPLVNSYHNSLPEIESSIKDLKGRIDLSTIKVKFIGIKTDNELVDKDLTTSFIISNQGDEDNYLLKGDSGVFEEGNYELSIFGKDFAGNAVEKVIGGIVYDSTPPEIAFQTMDNQLTNQPVFKVLATAFDLNPGQTQLIHNGKIILATNEIAIDHNVQLEEGLNTIEVLSVDLAGNIATKKGLYNITLDTIPPVLSEIDPINGSNVYKLNFVATGKSNEPLLGVKINGKEATLESNLKSFSINLSAMLEGEYPIEIVATDKAKNSTTLNLKTNIVLRVLNKDLITISPDPDNVDRLVITGSPGATRPGAEVRLYAGFFNQESFISNSVDGSFQESLEFFNSVEIRAKDVNLNRTDTANLTYNVDTTLAGVIKDTENKALSGVVVTIVGSGQQAVTDASGSFKIPKPATGDQVLSLDGNTIPVEVSGPNRKFSRVNIAVSIGTRQSNVLENPIYLAPLMFDGTETIVVDQSTDVVVESPHAEGVSLKIPAGTATFPDGRQTGVINVAEIDALYTAVPVLDFAKPQTVYAFEPSGLKFSSPVELTLPNVNEIPSGVQMVIMSKNSEKGIWEIDGLARVSEDGSEIVTEPGSGITHFSEIYAVPLGPKISEYAGTSHPGADMSMGIVQNSIEIPSYKVFGKDIAMNLSYKSIWADPTVVVSNIIDVPRNEYTFSHSASARSLLAKASVEISGKSWIEPESITASFYTDSLISQDMEFKGVPQKSLVSYAMDLNSLSTGLHTYNSHYDIKLKQLIFGTRTTRTKKLFGRTRTSQESFSETRILDEVFPQDMGGALYVQNYNNSKAGRGWRINGAGRIYNLDNPRVLVEESDGGTSSYAVNSNIETLYFNPGKELVSADLFNWPNISLYSENDRQVISHNLITTQTENYGSIPHYSGKFEGYSLFLGNNTYSNPNYCEIFCSIEHMSFTKEKKINSVFKLDQDQNIITTADGGVEIFRIGSSFKLGGHYFSPTSDYAWRYGADPWPAWYCPTYLGTSCYGEVKRAYSVKEYYTLQGLSSCSLPGDLNGMKQVCKDNGAIAQSTGEVGVPGFQDGSSPMFNSVTSIIKGYGDEIFLADFGNNRVRALNVQHKSSRTIAGNGQTYDSGDGGLAINASIYHPRALARDNLGNLYITSESGFIRKVDTNGYISTFAGKINGVLNDKSHASQIRLNNPHGMVFDSANGFLYVADTGHHRVVRINIHTKEATTVAGSGSCHSGNIGDGKAALLASLCNPTSLGLDDQNNLLVFDKGHSRVRRVNFDTATNGVIQYQAMTQDNSSLTKQSDGTFIRRFRNGAVFKYDHLGRQIFTEDRVGNRFTFSYNADNSLASVTDPTNRSTQYFYSGDKLNRIVDPQGRVTEFSYAGDMLTEVSFPDGSQRNFEYGPTGLMVNEFDKRGNQTSYFYNQWKRLSKVSRSDGSVINFQDGVSATIGNGFVGGQAGTLKSVSKNEIVDGIRDNKGIGTTLNKDENGFVSKMIDPKGGQYTIERDLDGRPLKITRPDNTIATFTYDNVYHDLISKSDTLTGVTINYQYDGFGNLVNQSLPNGETVSYVYASNTGLLLTKNLPLNTVESFEYYPNGLLKTKTNALGQRSSFVYGTFGNLVTATDHMGQSTQLVRDASGNVLTSTNAKSLTTAYSYDPFNRLTSVKSPRNELTSYEYLESGELAKIIDPENNETLFEYDSFGRLKKKIAPSNLVTELWYDQNDNLIKEVDPNGLTKIFEYDHLDRMIKKTLPDDIYELAYDERDNLKVIKNKHSEISFEYEFREGGSVLAKETTRGYGELSDLPQNVLEYEYDESSNRVELKTSEGRFYYNYDELNRLTKITNHKDEVFDFSYDQGGRVSQQRSPASVTSYQFDNVNFLTGISHKKRSNASTISSMSYTRDQIGNIVQMTTLKGDFNFTYDNNNQLISATHPEDVTSIYVYDALGNRITDQYGNYSYDSKKQRLVEDWKYTYVYDFNGNLSSKVLKSDPTKIVNYNYNSQNQLITLKEYDGTTLLKDSRYYYDALGRRVAKLHENHVDNGKSFARKYIYDGQEVLFELNGDNDLLTTFTHSTLRTDDVLAMDKGNASYFYLKDRLGTVNEIIDASGSVVQHYAYSAFGKIVSIKDGNGNDVTDAPLIVPYFTYTGREWDAEIGYYYYRARTYCPDTGRFIQADPHPGAMGNPITHINKYSYVGNNPTNHVDPSGEFFFNTTLLAGAAAFFGSGELQEVGRSWLFAEAAFGAIVLSGGSGVGALQAIGAVGKTSAIAAGIQTVAIGGGTQDFSDAFHLNFRIGTGFLALSAAGAGLFGGGIKSVGATSPNSHPLASQGYIVPNQDYFPAGSGLSLGGASTNLPGWRLHEFGHVYHFYGASAIAGYSQRNGGGYNQWTIYGASGALMAPFDWAWWGTPAL